MNVLHVIPSVSPVHGGPSMAIQVIERSLAMRGINVTTLTTDDDGPGRRLTGDAMSAKCNGVRRAYCRKFIEFYKIAPGMIGWLERELCAYDVVHIHALFSFSSIVAGFFCWLKGVPYIVRPLGTLAVYGVTQRRPVLKRLSISLFERRLLRNAAAVHFTSIGEEAEARAQGVAFDGVVIPLGIEMFSVGKLAASNRRSSRASGRCGILFLSRLDEKKNLESLLRAFAELRLLEPACELVIAGDGSPDYVAYLKELSAELGIAGAVAWLGHVAGEMKVEVFASADVFVLPSFSENFGIAAAEALLMGLPCVLGCGVAIAEEVERAGAGISVDPVPVAIREALQLLVGDAERRVAMGERAQRFAVGNYSAEVMAERLVTLYERVSPGRVLINT